MGFDSRPRLSPSAALLISSLPILFKKIGPHFYRAALDPFRLDSRYTEGVTCRFIAPHTHAAWTRAGQPAGPCTLRSAQMADLNRYSHRTSSIPTQPTSATANRGGSGASFRAPQRAATSRPRRDFRQSVLPVLASRENPRAACNAGNQAVQSQRQAAPLPPTIGLAVLFLRFAPPLR